MLRKNTGIPEFDLGKAAKKLQKMAAKNAN
jgi:hypothetical protein